MFVGLCYVIRITCLIREISICYNGSFVIPTAREGNVFRSVCHSVHRGVPILPPRGERPRSGQTPLSLWRETRVLTSGGDHCSSRYASYWNGSWVRNKSSIRQECIRIGCVPLHWKSRGEGVGSLPRVCVPGGVSDYPGGVFSGRVSAILCL